VKEKNGREYGRAGWCGDRWLIRCGGGGEREEELIRRRVKGVSPCRGRRKEGRGREGSEGRRKRNGKGGVGWRLGGREGKTGKRRGV
jgi:hypothetical protein